MILKDIGRTGYQAENKTKVYVGRGKPPKRMKALLRLWLSTTALLSFPSSSALRTLHRVQVLFAQI